MDYTDITVFITLVRTKNLYRTSELLSFSQSSISQRLKNLENELGGMLFERHQGKRSIELTPRGEAFLPLAQKWMNLWIETQQFHKKQEYPTLSIGCVDSLNSTVLPPLYQVLSEANAFKLSITSRHSHELYTLLEENSIDVGFVYKQYNRKNIHAEKVFSEKLYFIAPKSDVAYPPYISVNCLDPEKELYAHWSIDYELWHNKWFASGATPMISVDKFSLMELFFKRNNLWAIVPISYVKALSASTDLQICKIIENPPDRVCYKITSKTPRQANRQALELFNVYFEKFCQENDWLNADLF